MACPFLFPASHEECLQGLALIFDFKARQRYRLALFFLIQTFNDNRGDALSLLPTQTKEELEMQCVLRRCISITSVTGRHCVSFILLECVVYLCLVIRTRG